MGKGRASHGAFLTGNGYRLNTWNLAEVDEIFMDRISKALEKARLQRKQPAHDSESASRRPGGRQVRIPDPPLSITYDKTHVERVTPQVLADHRIIAGFSKHPQADTYRILRTQVLQRLAELNGNTLGISSPNPEDGKTLTSVNLAVSIAMTPTHTVLLEIGRASCRERV